jgi:release factor glutamine methyltransferase
LTTYGAALACAREMLGRAGIDSAALDSRLLLAAASGLETAALIAREREELPDLARALFDDHIGRRRQGEPVARILGEKEFRGLSFALGAATLVPRPETETLVEAVLAAAPRLPVAPTICDLGTGSGAILVALLAEFPDSTGVGIDVSPQALEIARLNAERAGVGGRIGFLQGDFRDTPSEAFDVMVSNPPYIRSGAIGALQPEVRNYDPLVALDGGPDGLAAYRMILGRIGVSLRPGGFAAFEVGHDQAESVAGLCSDAGLKDVRFVKDIAGASRVVTAAMPLFVPVTGAKKALGKVG